MFLCNGIFWKNVWKEISYQSTCHSRSSFSIKLVNSQSCNYRGSPDITVFAPPGNRTIKKTILFGDWFSTKIAIYDFWILKSPFLLIFKLFWFLKLNKWLHIWFHFETFIELFITNSDIFTRSQTISIHCLIFGYTFSDFCNNHQ